MSERIYPAPILLGDVTLSGIRTQTTVGAAGGATALPATPTGYIVVVINGAEYIVPYYAKS